MHPTKHLWSAALLLLGVPTVLRSAEAAEGRPTHVQASLLAADASLQPGRPVTVTLRLVRDAHWHTYWNNPGTGLPTSIEWTLPVGWTAVEIQWPAPRLLRDSRNSIVSNGYEHEVLLPVKGVFVAIGHLLNTKAFAPALDADENGHFKPLNGSQIRTRIPGVYVAGDCVDHIYRQAVTAGMGCAAAIEAERWLAEHGQ